MIKSRCAGGGLSFDSNSRSTPLHLPLSHTQTQKIYCKILFFFLLSLFVIVLSKPGWLEPGQAPATSVVSGQRNSSTDVSVSTSSRLYYVMPTIYIYIYLEFLQAPFTNTTLYKDGEELLYRMRQVLLCTQA